MSLHSYSVANQSVDCKFEICFVIMRYQKLRCRRQHIANGETPFDTFLFQWLLIYYCTYSYSLLQELFLLPKMH